MRALLSWSHHLPHSEGAQSVCYDFAFRPDGSQLIAAVGIHVLVYDAVDGDLLHSLKGHKDVVYCVAYSRDGKRFASGGADKTIIIWTHKAEGILKYNHNDSVQCLAYNPITQQLASGTARDFGIWSPEQKTVSKFKAESKVLCMAWTGDGQYLALGMYNGCISLCDKNGDEHMNIERDAPVWTLQWNLKQNKMSDTLVAGCWDGTLSFYNLLGRQVGKDINLGFSPCSIAYHDGKYLCIGGTNKKVHGLHLEYYAFREDLTDVVIQNLITNVKVTIKGHEYIKKIGIYQKRVAVQLSTNIFIYEMPAEGMMDGQHCLCARINGSFDCNLLVLTSEHITICQCRSRSYNFTHSKEGKRGNGFLIQQSDM